MFTPLLQVSCVINNFKPSKLAVLMPPPPQRPEPPTGLPLLTLPRVESPLQKLSVVQVGGLVVLRLMSIKTPTTFWTLLCVPIRLLDSPTLRSHDHQPTLRPAPPDVLLPSRCCLTSAVWTCPLKSPRPALPTTPEDDGLCDESSPPRCEGPSWSQSGGRGGDLLFVLWL